MFVCAGREAKRPVKAFPRAIFERAPTAALHKIKRKIFISGSSSLFVDHRQQATMLQSVYNATGALCPGTLAREHRELEWGNRRGCSRQQFQGSARRGIVQSRPRDLDLYQLPEGFGAEVVNGFCIGCFWGVLGELCIELFPGNPQGTIQVKGSVVEPLIEVQAEEQRERALRI